MRIGVFGTRGFPLIQGGVEKHCESLYSRIAGPDRRIIVYRRKPYASPSAHTHYPGIEFIDLPSTKIKGFETIWHSFLSTCNILTQHVDIVHIHNIGPALFTPILRLFGKKVVLTYHSANYEHKKWNVAEQKILRFCEYTALKHANAILFVNHFQMEKMRQIYPDIGQKSYYTPNGIDAPVYPDSSGELDKWGIKEMKYILSVGRITPEKGFDVLIKAFSSVDSDFKLVIAGGTETETDYYKELTGLIDKSKVVFTGFVYGEALQQLYMHAKLFVMPSFNEGFPLVLLEAMSYQLPLIVSDIPATHLVHLPPPCYFPAGDVNVLADKLNNFIEIEPTEKPLYDLSSYDWNKIAEQTIEIYHKLL